MYVVYHVYYCKLSCCTVLYFVCRERKEKRNKNEWLSKKALQRKCKKLPQYIQTNVMTVSISYYQIGVAEQCQSSDWILATISAANQHSFPAHAPDHSLDNLHNVLRVLAME